MHHSLLVLFTKLNDSAFDLLPAFDVVSFFTEKKGEQKLIVLKTFLAKLNNNMTFMTSEANIK